MLYERAKWIPPDHPRRVALDRKTSHRLCRNSWRKLSQEIMDTLPDGPNSCVVENPFITPPWAVSHGKWTVELTLPDSTSIVDTGPPSERNWDYLIPVLRGRFGSNVKVTGFATISIVRI